MATRKEEMVDEASSATYSFPPSTLTLYHHGRVMGETTTEARERSQSIS